MEKQKSRKEIYSGKIIHVVCDDIVLDDGSQAKREVVYHKGGVCIALKDLSDNKFYLVRQYRYALQADMIEFCAGKIEENENPDVAIIRECIEELGIKPKNIKKLNYMVPTCGYSSEKIYLYYAEKGEEIGQHLDKDERIEIIKLSYKEIQEMIKTGQIVDGKTIALMQRLEMEGNNV